MLLYWIIPFGAAVILAAFISQISSWPIDKVQSWLLAMTAVTFITYAFDKMVAKINPQRQKQKTFLRAPERLLLALTFAGGTIGALLAIFIFNHKTAKISFQRKLWLTLGLQILLIAIYFYYFSGEF